MSNLLILPPGIPFDAAQITSTIAEADTTTSIWNTVKGPRYTRSVAASAGNRYYNYDLGSNYAAKYAGADFVVLARADINPLTEYYLVYSQNYINWFTASSDSSISSAERLGPQSADYVATFNNISTAQRYWEIQIRCASGATKLSKIYFGKAINFTNELADMEQDRRPPTSAWYAGSGAARVCESDSPVYTFSATWDGITDAELENFRRRVLRYAKTNPVFLYTTGNHDLLDNQRLIHARITGAKIKRTGSVHNYWSLNVSFEELLG